jgi:hypothetical protein
MSKYLIGLENVTLLFWSAIDRRGPMLTMQVSWRSKREDEIVAVGTLRPRRLDDSARPGPGCDAFVASIGSAIKYNENRGQRKICRGARREEKSVSVYVMYDLEQVHTNVHAPYVHPGNTLFS